MRKRGYVNTIGYVLILENGDTMQFSTEEEADEYINEVNKGVETGMNEKEFKEYMEKEFCELLKKDKETFKSNGGYIKAEESECVKHLMELLYIGEDLSNYYLCKNGRWRQECK